MSFPYTRAAASEVRAVLHALDGAASYTIMLVLSFLAAL